MPSPLATQTLARLQQARRTRSAVSLPEVIKLIEELSSRAFSISVPELADLIGHDTLVTAKVIQTANTFGYNPFGQPVLTVTQAIHVVGFNKIRNLTLSMLLMENAAHGAHPQSQRESAALALCSGLLAQALAARRSGLDAEQAFVFACLRHYGRLLLTTFLSEDFEQVLQRPAAESETDACRRVFGLTPLEISSALFEESGLPRPSLRCLQDLSSVQLAASPSNAEEELAAVTQFAAALGELIISPQVGAHRFADEAERLRHSFDRKLGLPETAMADLVGAVDQSLQAFARAYGTRALASGIVQRIGERASQTEPQPVLPEGILLGCMATQIPSPPPTPPVAASAPSRTESATVPCAPAPPSPPVAVAPTPPPASVSAPGLPPRSASAPQLPPALAAPPVPPCDGSAELTECLLELTARMASLPLDLHAMEFATLIAIRRALHLSDCLLFQREGHSQTFSSSLGVGDLAALVRSRPLIEADRRDIFGIALSRCEDVLIRDTTDPKLRPFLPGWLTGAGPVASFILLPLHNEGRSFALVLGTRTHPPALQPLPRELQLLKALRQHLTSARRLASLSG